MRKSLLKKLAVLFAVALMVPPTVVLAYTGQNVTGNISFNASFGETLSTGLINSETFNQAIQQTDNYTAGTGSAQVDTFYAAQLVLNAAPQTLDLTSLTDPAGKVANFARVRELIVQNTASGSAGFDVKVSAAASNGVTFLPASTAPLMNRYGSVMRISDRYSTGSGNGNVIGATTKSITFDPSANSVTINVIIVGGSSAFVLILPFGLRRYRRRAA